MYKFRYHDIHLGSITIRFNSNSEEDIDCFCTRVVIRESRNNKKDKKNNEVSYWENWQTLTIYEDYIFNGACTNTDSETNLPDESAQVQDSNTGHANRKSSCCKLCGFCKIFQLLRRDLKFCWFSKKLHSDPQEENYAEFTNTDDQGNQIRAQNSTDTSRKSSLLNNCAELINESVDPIQDGLLRMGYLYDVSRSEYKTLNQRVFLTYNILQLQELNENLILPKPFTESMDMSTSGNLSKKKQILINTNVAQKQWPLEIEMNPELQKYWFNRYRLFSKFDNGIRLDAESWYSVTPEKISRHLADRCRCDVIVDGFCGAGGNTIQFAFTCERVIAIDIDPNKIKLAKHNAEIYNVADRIEFIVGDFFKIAPSLKADVVFLSPPWGGPNYRKRGSFPLKEVIEPYGGKYLYDFSKMISKDIAFYLPRNVNIHEVMKLDGPGSKVEIEQNIMNRKLVALTAYFGELVFDPNATD